ncbi:O-methylsterigmatocystin oxidoreductase [Beauveria brongniartii RCEF 3172]|uniref:O-methylsterigmatocystin oxidoreductase n=1 Tax=Beauveria brongniartii RCEF 3172 TaxID=1081107 RepID=A0A166VNP0_9HYPO|nr:O-methylsterigmatocystin oxidoreductase [Beauveria brongniartii RCEF 3172]
MPDPLVNLGESVVNNLSYAFNPGAWLVDYIPILKFLPDGFPGTAFKDTARQCKGNFNTLLNVPYLFVCQQMNEGTYQSSYVSNLIEQYREGEKGSNLSRNYENAIKSSAAVLYIGATDSTVSSLNSFIFVMAMFPTVQHKAQAEIDLVIGSNRLPRFEDRDKLPYVNGIVKELHRWSPVTPMGFPHISEEDINYNGYLIPKGAYLLPAIWWFCYDPEVYSEPETFNPERYLEPHNEPDPKSHIFGYGRRICPGQHFADSNIFLTVAQTLAAFKINKTTSKQEVEKATIEIGTGIANENRLVNFHYEIVPRSGKQAELLQGINITELGKTSDASLLGDSILDRHK